MDGGLIFQHAKAADGIYQAGLRAELSRRLGVAWERRDEQWEIHGVPPGLCRRWSTRRSQITAALAARGLDPDTASGRAAQVAALDTRQLKVEVGEGRSLHDRFAREAIAAGHHPRSIIEVAVPSRLQQRRQRLTQLIEPGRQLLDAVTGPEGVTQRASSFSRRDAVIDLTTRSAILSTNADDVALRTEALLQHLMRDQRVVPVLAPGPRTSSEVLRVRDATGRIVRTVDQSERRYTTVDLLSAETELLHRATTRRDAGVAVVPRCIVVQVLAANPTLDADQQAMIRTLASSGAGVDVVVGKAGTGKSTALGAYRQALDTSGIPAAAGRFVRHLHGRRPPRAGPHRDASRRLPDSRATDPVPPRVRAGRQRPPRRPSAGRALRPTATTRVLARGGPERAVHRMTRLPVGRRLPAAAGDSAPLTLRRDMRLARVQRARMVR